MGLFVSYLIMRGERNQIENNQRLNDFDQNFDDITCWLPSAPQH